MDYSRELTRIAFVCVIIADCITVARADDQIQRLADGRYLVQLSDVTVALPEEDPKNKLIGFYVSTPPGTSPFQFYLTDLVRDPARYAPRLRSSEWSSVSAMMSYDHTRDIIGVPVVKGVNQVGIHSGVDRNCEAWQPEWARHRETAVTMTPDQYGWIRQDYSKNPPTSMFIKFLDGGDRRMSRYYAVSCDFAGGCSARACRDSLTAWISFYSSNKIQGEDYSVKDFDEQIASGIKVLEHMLPGKVVDLSHP